MWIQLPIVFFVRIAVEGVEETLPVWKELKDLLPEGAEIAVNPTANKKVIVPVTKEYHSLGDILIRNPETQQDF